MIALDCPFRSFDAEDDVRNYELIDTENEATSNRQGKPTSRTLHVPYRWICRVQPKIRTTPGGTWTLKESGTGVLIGPRHVLTAAHVIDEYTDLISRGLVEIDVKPAFDGTRSLGGTYRSTRFIVGSRWHGTKKSDPLDSAAFDYGLIIMSSNDISTDKHRRLKNRPLGYWGHPSLGFKTVLAPRHACSLSARTVHTAGYPRCSAPRMWAGDGKLSGIYRPGSSPRVVRRSVQYNAPVCSGAQSKGLSGGPVWQRIKGKNTRFLVGINHGVFPEQVSSSGRSGVVWRVLATRLTVEMFEEINEWLHRHT